MPEKTAVQLSEALKKDSGRSEYKDKLVLKTVSS